MVAVRFIGGEIRCTRKHHRHDKTLSNIILYSTPRHQRVSNSQL